MLHRSTNSLTSGSSGSISPPESPTAYKQNGRRKLLITLLNRSLFFSVADKDEEFRRQQWCPKN